MSEFDVNGYNSHECDIHNHGYYLGAQSQQVKIHELQKQVITQGQNFNDQAQKLKDAEYFNQELQSMVDDLKELNRLKTIALQQSLNRTLIHVHEKIIALEKKLKGNKDEN